MNWIDLLIILGAQIVILGGTIFILSKFFVGDYVQGIINDVGEGFSESLENIFEKPAVSHAMSIMGKKSGEVRNLSAANNEMSMAILNKKIGPYKIILQSALGIDIDEMIEEHGAPAVLELAQKYIPMVQGFLPKKGGGKTNNSSRPLDYLKSS